ncbi:unnamed protein product [Polarella glacialis]|uniref:Macro domain-containing protein n=1 Tax=Polarella glacialis TaxID=89957 RepID=A0A813HHD4_POLGL|nr:unnamed protein product [Polarella glacialis]
MAGLRAAWEAHGPGAGGVLPASAQVQLHALEAKPELNGKVVTLVRWDGPSQRFIVAIQSGDRIKVRASCLQGVRGYPLQPSWINLEGGLMPADLSATVALFLPTRAVAALSGAARALRAELWLRPGGQLLWEALLVRSFGAPAVDMARAARPGVSGPALFRGARGLRQIFGQLLEVVRGGIQTQATGVEVVACPTVRSLALGGRGAQVVIRQAAGPELEEAIQAVMQLRSLLPEMSCTLFPGGALAPHVAMVVTEPPEQLWGTLRREDSSEQTQGILSWLTRLHGNLFQAVREGGFRSLAMPTLCTGGIGVPVHLVAIGALRALHRDFSKHPTDPIRVRVACFEAGHVYPFNNIKDEILANFFLPEKADEAITAALLDGAERQDGSVFDDDDDNSNDEDDDDQR